MLQLAEFEELSQVVDVVAVEVHALQVGEVVEAAVEGDQVVVLQVEPLEVGAGVWEYAADSWFDCG